MSAPDLSKQYIDLLKKSLVNELYVENEARLIHAFNCELNKQPVVFNNFLHIRTVEPVLFELLKDSKTSGNSLVMNQDMPDGTQRLASEMRNITELSHSMIGKTRLENLQYCIETVLAEGIPGDFIETGIWRGGACIFMRGILKAYGVTDRTIWAADSFEGVPVPTRPEDAGFDLSRNLLPVLEVDLDQVKELFTRYDLLDEQVVFLKGWFKDTLPTAPIKQLAVLRLDGDLYESTIDALVPLYDKVSQGGFIIVDDYGSCPPCQQAIHDFRAEYEIPDEMKAIDSQSVYWRKS